MYSCLIFLKINKNHFFSWLERINKGKQPKSEINAFHFGLVGFVDQGHAVYLIGSSTYGKEEEWQCCVDFVPKEKFFILKEQFKKQYSDDEWKEVLDNTEKLIIEFISSLNFVNHFISKGQTITLGFDEGDIIKII